MVKPTLYSPDELKVFDLQAIMPSSNGVRLPRRHSCEKARGFYENYALQTDESEGMSVAIAGSYTRWFSER